MMKKYFVVLLMFIVLILPGVSAVVSVGDNDKMFYVFGDNTVVPVLVFNWSDCNTYLWSNNTGLYYQFCNGSIICLSNISNNGSGGGNVYWADNSTLNLNGFVFSFNQTWGDSHYLTSFSESDPWFNSSDAYHVTSALMSNWNISYDERGSVIAGDNLSWDGSKLNVVWSDFTGFFSRIGHTHPFNYSGYDQDLNMTDDVTFNNITINDSLIITKNNDAWNIYVDDNGTLVWEEQ